MDNQIEAVVFKSQTGHVLVGEAVEISAKFPCGYVGCFDQIADCTEFLTKIVRLIEMEDMKAVELRLDSLEAPEQHPDAL